jgi:hypothetical protein
MEVTRFFAEHKSGVTNPIEIDEATNKRLRWMVHKRVLVVMVVTYFGQIMDKLSDMPSCFPMLANLSSRTISFASIMGIVQDAHLVGQQYAWLTTCGTYLFRNYTRCHCFR